MSGGWRRLGTVAMLGLALGLSGCAAGSPGVVAPETGDGGQAVAAPVLTPAASDAPVAVAADTDDGAADTTDVAGGGDGAVVAAEASGDGIPSAANAPAELATEAAAGPATTDPLAPAAGALDDAAAAVSGAGDAGTAAGRGGAVAPAFAADPGLAAAPATGAVAAPAVAGAEPVAAAPVAQPAAPAPAVGEAAPAPAAQIERPPAPPTDGSGLSQVIEGGSNGRKEVALTFDAGADTGYAEAILDLLRDEGIVATFGMTGAWAEANPDLIRRMVAEGHHLINHTWSHGSLTGANTGEPAWTYEQLADELARTEQVIRDLTGYELKPYFRPPYGDYDETSLRYLADLGYPFTIWWTCDTRGWAGWDAQRIFETCTQVPLEDEIYLMHVGAAAAGDFEVLPLLIAHYRGEGYAFTTVEQMLQP